MSVGVFKRRIGLTLVMTLLVMILSGIIFAPSVLAADVSQETEQVAVAKANNAKWGLVSAAVAFAAGAISAGFAISRVGTAAMGALSEKPEIGSQALIFIALAEGLCVFGFIACLMILGRI